MNLNSKTAPETTDYSGFFITGTDTDVGKTYVAGCIATSLIKRGNTVTPRKPIASGCIRLEDGHLLPEDALFLQQSCQSPEDLDTICPYQFEPAISPHSAIKNAGLNISIQHLKLACQTDNHQFTLVEGAGGFYSPLAQDGLNKDLAVQLNYPVILVVANRIGCINQTLLSIEAIKQSGLVLHSIIVNQMDPLDDTDYADGINDYTDCRTYRVTYSTDGKPCAIPSWSP